MKLLIQRVKEASVAVEGQVVGKIDAGLLIFVGITHSDTRKEASWLASKVVNLRIFEDSQGKMNRSLLESEGGALIISQFTLYADCEGGRRPAFTRAAPPEVAIPLYEFFVEEVRSLGVPVATGVFGALMQVSLINDGPVTIMLERNN
jgi:D-tyrosyl-tRNA(Tyr) deacylase